MSDEQRKQFEANFLACSPMSLPSDFTRDSVGGYENDYLQQRWHGWVEGQRARDAEVEALRAELISVRQWVRDLRAELHSTVERDIDVALLGGKDNLPTTAEVVGILNPEGSNE